MNADCHTSNGIDTLSLPDASASWVNSSTYGGGTSSSRQAPSAGTNALQYTALRSREVRRFAAPVRG